MYICILCLLLFSFLLVDQPDQPVVFIFPYFLQLIISCRWLLLMLLLIQLPVPSTHQNMYKRQVACHWSVYWQGLVTVLDTMGMCLRYDNALLIIYIWIYLSPWYCWPLSQANDKTWEWFIKQKYICTYVCFWFTLPLYYWHTYVFYKTKLHRLAYYSNLLGH